MLNKILVFIVLALSFGMNGCVVASKTFNIDEALGLKTVQKPEYMFNHDTSAESAIRMRTWLGPLAQYVDKWSIKRLHESFDAPPIGYNSINLSSGYGGLTTSELQETNENRVTLIIRHKLWSGGYIWRALTAERIRAGHWVPVLNPDIPESEHLRSNYEYRTMHGIK